MSNSQRYLLDTNIFLWSLDEKNKLKDHFRKILEDPTVTVFVSTITFWEISIKDKTGKLPLKTNLRNCLEKSSFEILNVDINHIIQVDKLPPIHKDPFDRILIAQAKAENLTLITTDAKIKKYDVKVL